MNSRLLFLLVGVVGAWVLAFNSGRELAFSLAYLLTAIFAISAYWANNSVRGVSVNRGLRSKRSQVGQYAEEMFEVSGDSWWPKLWIELQDQSTLPWHSTGRVVNMLRKGHPQRWQVKTLCTQRGRFRMGPLALYSGDPLGIFSSRKQISTTSYLIVYPPTLEITSFEATVSELAGGDTRQRRTNQVTTTVAGIRDYATGDAFNRIHWPTSIRAGKLMVKEFELDPSSDVWLYLDLFKEAATALPWSPPEPEPAIFAAQNRRRNRLDLPPATVEYAVTVAASLARYFLLEGRAVGINSRGHTRELVQSDRGERQLNKFLEALAVVEAVGALPFANLITTDGVRLNRNDTLVAISADHSPQWAIGLQQLQRRGVNSVAIIIDAATFGSERSYDGLLSELAAASIPTYRIRKDDPIERVLNGPAEFVRRR
jgi:uncharacterized protein (DUF58 family)